MKTQNEMRSEFEKLEEIKDMLCNCGGGYYKPQTNSYHHCNIYLDKYLNGAWYAFQEKQKEIDLFNKMILGLRNEFNLWADDTESFNAIEAQIENLEELLK